MHLSSLYEDGRFCFLLSSLKFFELVPSQNCLLQKNDDFQHRSINFFFPVFVIVPSFPKCVLSALRTKFQKCAVFPLRLPSANERLLVVRLAERCRLSTGLDVFSLEQSFKYTIALASDLKDSSFGLLKLEGSNKPKIQTVCRSYF